MTVRRSLAYSVVDSYLSVAMQLASTMIIARLLTPTEAGIFAVAAVFAAFASTFRDFGVGEYLIQERELTSDKIRAALTANIAVSWLMGILLFVSSDLVADFYHNPGIASIMRVQAVNFAFIPFGAVTMSYFRRQLNFRPIFIASMLSGVTSFAVATIFASLGFGYMSLAWSSLAGVLVTVSTSLWFRPTDFPRWPGLVEIRNVVHFGKHASGISILGQIGKSAPEIIIGRALDMSSVAYFSRAGALIEMFHRMALRPVFLVCMPYFAKSNRDDGTVVNGYLRTVSYLTAVGWPFFIFLGITAYGAVRLVYGSQWTPSVPLAQILCGAAMIEIVFVLAKDAMTAVGRIDRSNLLQLGVQGSRVIGLLCIIPFGLVGACWGWLGAAVFGAGFARWILARTIGLRTQDIIKACLPSVYIAIITTMPLAIWTTFDTVSETNYLYFLFGGGFLTAALWLASVRHFMPTTLWIEITNLQKRIASKLASHA